MICHNKKEKRKMRNDTLTMMTKCLFVFLPKEWDWSSVTICLPLEEKYSTKPSVIS